MAYDPREFFDAGFADFLRREADHIISGVSERNLCARLMLRLEAIKGRFGFGGYDLDTDYNRMNGQDVKYMLGDGGGRIKIECDLLVHPRGSADNLIAFGDEEIEDLTQGQGRRSHQAPDSYASPTAGETRRRSIG